MTIRYYSPTHGLFVSSGNWGQSMPSCVGTNVVTLLH